MAGADKKKRRSVQPPSDDAHGGDMGDEYDEDNEMAPVEEKRVPKGQVQLEEEQLSEIFTKMITAGDPNVSKAKTRFSYTENEFVHVGLTASDHIKVHFCMEGDLILADSDEARDQAALKVILEAKRKIEESKDTPDEKDSENDYPEDVLSGKLALKNQFNFSERATQTFNNPKRKKAICTEPPPKRNYCAQVSKWEIHDAYLKEFEKKAFQASMMEGKKKVVGGKNDEEEETQLATVQETEVNVDPDAELFGSVEMARAMQVMERMVHTNSEAEAFHDFKFLEDKSRAEDGKGQFFPLWRFIFEKAQRKTVSSICWNPEFPDLFAVGYGSYDFVKQGSGLICCFSLKNTSFPEYVFETESGVMCLDFHPDHSSLLCVGLYDGSVSVYDVRNKDKKPIYVATSPKLKHTDPVWQVYWSRESNGEEKPLSFFSVSSDGRVSSWILNKSELLHEEVTEIKLYKQDGEEGENNSNLVGLAGACSFDFNKTQEHLMIVGTEEGAIHSYSNAYNSQYLRSFEGHHMGVYSVRWNQYHPRVFLSCSADWTVKLWELNTPTPILTFDLNTSVGDIAWAPFSSTVFAVITADGKVRVYDLSVNKHEPVGETKVNKKAKLTHICFNPKDPIICVGDDRGVVQILKLSSNLRKMSASCLEEVDTANEIARLDEVMIIPEDEKTEDINALLEKAVQSS